VFFFGHQFDRLSDCEGSVAAGAISGASDRNQSVPVSWGRKSYPRSIPFPNPSAYSTQNPSISLLCPAYSARLYTPRTPLIVLFSAFSTVSADQ
jgi:hypothetical protein